MPIEKKIKILSGDVFNYVVGRTYTHPIDAALDLDEEGRYEAQATFIYDSESKLKEVQDLEYLTFFMELEKCRQKLGAKLNPRRSEVVRLSEELAEMAPEKVTLPVLAKLRFNEGHKFDFGKKSNDQLRELFGLDSSKDLKLGDFKISKEEALIKAYDAQESYLYKGLI